MIRGLFADVRARHAARIAGVAAFAFVLFTPALAHHAWNEIDTMRTFQLIGKVKSLKWENPHASLVLEVSEGERKGEWTVLMSGLARMEARGVAADTVAVGKTLTLTVSPSRGDAHVVRANRIASGVRTDSTADAKDYVLY